MSLEVIRQRQIEARDRLDLLDDSFSTMHCEIELLQVEIAGFRRGPDRRRLSGQVKMLKKRIAILQEISSAASSARSLDDMLRYLEQLSATTARWNRAKGVFRPPGCALAKLAEFIYSKRTYQEVFLPIFSDLQLEYQEALAEKRWNKASLIAIRGRWAFVAAVLTRIPISITRLAVTLWKLGSS